MSDDKTPVDTALDLLVYAPIGLVFEARNLVPRLAERGRQQVTMARMVGEFAVRQGSAEAGKRLSGLFGRGGQQGPSGDGGAAAGSGPASSDGQPAGEPPPEAAEPVADRSAPDDAALAIPDYDSLSASQVVPHLAGLSAEELEAVRAYEAETRGRKTILNRIAQLQQA